MRSLILGLLLACPVTALCALEGQLQLAQSYAKEAGGDVAGALNAIDSLQKNHPDDYLLALRLGWLHYRLGAYQTASGYYQTACRICPNAIEARLGAILPPVAQRQWPEVERQARAALRLDPAQTTANRWLAEALLAQNHPREAVDVAVRLSEHYPADATITELLARSRTANREYAEARAAYGQLLRLDPTNAAAKAALASER